MSIKEYADSMNCTVQEILNKCRELGIKASDKDVCGDIFDRGLCLPSDIKMTDREQDIIIKIIRECFK